LPLLVCVFKDTDFFVVEIVLLWWKWQGLQEMQNGKAQRNCVFKDTEIDNVKWQAK